MSGAESSRYDRQIRLWGKTAQLKLMETNVFFRNILHVSAEVSKNLVLSGVQRVFVEDAAPPSKWDFETNFLLQNSPLCGTAGKMCSSSLQRLNPYVKVIDGFPLDINKDTSSVSVIVEQVQSLHDIYATLQYSADMYVFICVIGHDIVSFFLHGDSLLTPLGQMQKLCEPSTMDSNPSLVQKAIIFLHVNQHDELDFVSRLALANDYALALKTVCLQDVDIQNIAANYSRSHTDSSGITVSGAAIAQLIVTTITTTTTKCSWLSFNSSTRCISSGVI